MATKLAKPAAVNRAARQLLLTKNWPDMMSSLLRAAPATENTQGKPDPAKEGRAVLDSLEESPY
jgi:hypothetical protein